jgi:hypothetical protein
MEHGFRFDLGDKAKTLGIGATVGLVIGPQLGVILIRLAHVPYLETRFAFGRLALGLLVGIILGFLGASFMGSRVERKSPSSVKALIALGIIVNIAETVFIIRRIIP